MWLRKKLLKSSTERRYDLLMGAPIKFRKEECALGTEQRTNDAASKDVQTKLSREECARSMEQRSINAAVRDAQIILRKEDCAESRSKAQTMQ